MRSELACGGILVEQRKKCSQAQHFGVFVMLLFVAVCNVHQQQVKVGHTDLFCLDFKLPLVCLYHTDNTACLS